MSEVAALEARVDRLETQIGTGFDRIESLLRQEINDLKAEQINELREANKRLADDQRRLWDRVVDMERRENRREGDHKGQYRILASMGTLVAAIIGGVVTWLATWLTSGGGGPPAHPH